MTPRLQIGTRKGLFEYTRGAAGWQLDKVHFLGEPVSMLLTDPRDGAMYAGLALGHFGAKLRRLDRGESTWHECGVPVYPAGSEYNAGPPMDDQPPPKKPASLVEIWSLEAGGANEPGVLWAGTIPGGLFRSSDRGETWQLNESLWNRPERDQWFGGGKDSPGIHSICVDPRDSRKVSVAVSCGGAWRTVDGGETWTIGVGMRNSYMPPNLAYEPSSQDPHRMVACPKSPDQMWIQHHNGIFTSQDAGLNWREITTAQPSAFGFAVAAHPHDAKTAWFVPATVDQVRVPVDGRVVVSRTRDGGESFDVLTNGLPAENAYDIVFRHSLDVDSSGSTLAFGSTTGGLWVSENAGDQWNCISHTLPPIYCLRFVSA